MDCPAIMNLFLSQTWKTVVVCCMPLSRYSDMTSNGRRYSG
jgi:hypothetical protein